MGTAYTTAARAMGEFLPLEPLLTFGDPDDWERYPAQDRYRALHQSFSWIVRTLVASLEGDKTVLQYLGSRDLFELVLIDSEALTGGGFSSIDHWLAFLELSVNGWPARYLGVGVPVEGDGLPGEGPTRAEPQVYRDAGGGFVVRPTGMAGEARYRVLLEPHNADSGGAGVVSGATTLTDSGKSWTGDEWKNGWCFVNGQLVMVSGNSATALTLASGVVNGTYAYEVWAKELSCEGALLDVVIAQAVLTLLAGEPDDAKGMVADLAQQVKAGLMQLGIRN